MAGRDLSAEIFGPADGGGQGRDLSDEIFGAVQPVKDSTFGSELVRGGKQLASSFRTGIGALVGSPEEAAKAGLQRSEAIAKEAGEGASLEAVKRAYEEKGLLSAAGEVASQTPRALASQAAQLALMAGGAKAGALAGTAVAPGIGTVIGGALGAGATLLPQLFGSNVERQASEQMAGKEEVDINRLAAGAGAVGQTALETAAPALILGKRLVKGLLGITDDAALVTAQARQKTIDAANRSLLSASGRGAVRGAAVEIPVEIASSIIERAQAGLDVTSPDAFAEYGEVAYQSALIGGPLGAVSGAGDTAVARQTVKTQPSDALQQVQDERDQFAKEFGEGTPVDVPAPVAAVELPGGFTVTQRELSREEVPESYGIFAEGSDKPLTTVATQADIDPKITSLTEIRAEEQARLLKESDAITKNILAEQRKIDVMEATGQTDTDEYVQAKALLAQKELTAAEQIQELNDKIASYSAPLSFAPIGQKTNIQSDFVATRGEEIIGSYPTFEEAEATLRAAEPEVFKQADLEAETLRAQADATRLDELLRPLITKFNLGDVGLNIVDRIANNAGGSYSGLNKLIEISMTGDKPLLTMRHEALHALKDLEFFTPQQWKALTERANKDWLVQLKKTPYEEGTSRYDAYLDMFTKEGQAKGLQGPELEQYANEALIEEAIADAFGAYESGVKPPPGLIAALFKKLQNFFKNFGQALRGAGFESSEDIFERVERGELKSRKPKKAVEEKVEKPEQTMGERLSLLRKANPDEIDISTQNPQGVNRIYDPITEMLSIDAEAVGEAMKANPKIGKKIIQAIKSYGFIPDNTPDNKVLEVFKENIVNNLLFLYNKVPESTRKRSKLWYVGANKIAIEMGKNYDMSLRQIAAIMAAMSPQKDWFQNVSMAERAIDVLQKQGNQAWTPDMLRYAESYVKETKDRKEREKRGDAFEKIKKVANAGTVLNDMDEKSAAAFIRAYDEAFHSRNYRLVTPEGGFGDLVRNNDGKPSTMMWSTYGPIEKAVSIYRDGSRENVSQQLGFEHKIRSFYNNIANPDSEIDHVTIDTHAVAAALFEALAGTDTEVAQNFGATGSSDVLGVGGTYGLIADAYREAAKRVGVRAREMQSITWEAVRALFSEEVKASIKPKIRAEWAKYKTGQQSFDETRQNVLEIAGQPNKLNDPDWIDSGVGQFVSDGGTSYDKTFTPVGGVRLREEREIREKFTFNLSAVTNSIPGLRELYSKAMKGDDRAYELLQKVAESSLQYLLKGTGAKIKVEYSKGVYQADREPSISVSASFEERDQKAVMSALAKFAENYNQQQIHVRVPTIRKLGYEFGDGSYATPVYEIPLPKKLNNAQISDIINQTGLQGFSVSERQVATKDGKVTENFLTAYWVAPNEIDQELESFDKFEQAARAAQAMAGVEGSKPRRTVERLYVYGSGPGATIGYEDIQSDLLPREGTDTVTPRLIAEYLRGEPVKVFKQKDLTNNQVEGQKLLAKVFDELPTKDLKNPLVRQAYNALNKELVKQYNAMPIKVKLVNGQRDEDGNFIDIYRNSAEMRKDVSNNNRFKVYKTEPGTFGPEGFNFKDHPLLKDSGVKDIDGKDMLFNDVLRAVHDYYAHNLADNEFGPKGESAAWRNHMSVTADPLARWALTAETRAQNAWQNFREGAEDIPLKDRPFADQKAMLPPIGFTFTGEANVDQVMADYAATLTPEQQLGSLPSTSQYADDVRKQIPKTDKSKKYSLRQAPTTPEFKRFFGDSKVVNKDGNPKVMYHGTSKDVTDFTRKEMRGAPIFLTDDPAFADRFALDSVDVATARVEQVLSDEQIAGGRKLAIAAIRKDYRARPEGKVMIDSINTKDYSKATPEAKEYLRKAYAEMMPSGPNVMPVYVSAQNPFDYENPSHIRRVLSELDEDAYNPEDIRTGSWEAIETADFQEAIGLAGFDSFYVKENGRKNIAVYKSSQVKSAIGNDGTYGVGESDVRYSLKNVSFPSVKTVKEAVETTSIPKTDAFKQFIAGNQWSDSDGNPKVFYHATARDFFEFTPAGKTSGVIYLSDTPEEAEVFGKIAEDRLRQQVYRALTKDEKIDFFQRLVDAKVEKGSMTENEGTNFIRQAKRKIPDFGKFGDLEKEIRAGLIDLSPTRMSIMPLYARAETPFDFRNPEHIAQVASVVRRPDPKLSEKAIKEARELRMPSEYPDNWYRGLPGLLKQGFLTSIEQEPVQTAIRKLGFDGYVGRQNRNSPIVYAVYKPEQVKSVTGNIGEYGRESKDIRFSLPTIPTNITDRVNETTFTRERKGFAQRMIEAISPQSAAYFRAKNINRYNQQSVYDKKRAEEMGGAALLADQSAESAALMSDLGAGIAASAMGIGDRNGGIPVLRNGITTIDTSVKGLVASLAPLASYNDPKVYQLYQYWAMVKRGQRLDKQGKLTGITTTDVAYAKDIEARFPKDLFNNVQKDLTAFNNGLVKYMVDTGVLSKERGAEYTKYADYIPFYRQMDGENTIGPNLFQSLSGVKPPKKLKGKDVAEAPLADFLETMVRNTQSAIQAGIKNYAGQRTINVATQVKAPGMGATRLPKPSTAPDVINVLEKGELVSYSTPDMLLIDAMKSLNLSDLPFMGILSAPADLLRNLVTKDPGFMMANLLRDSLSAYVTSGVKMTPVVDTVMAYGKSLTRNSPTFEALLNAGIISGYDSGNIEKSGLNLEEDLAKKAGQKDALLLRPFKSLWGALEKGTTASDAATRVVIYERIMAETGNEAEALFRSLEVMNFHRKGSSALIRVLTAAVPFFNARLQGLDLFYRASTGNMNNKDAAAIQRQFFVRGMTMMALSAAYWFMVSDDEEYKKQEQETKDNNWLIPYLGIRIPIPFEVGVLFKTIPERLVAYTFGNDTGKDLRDALLRNATSTFAFNPIPQTVKPLVEVAFNINTFTWRPIVSEGMQDVAPEFQVGPGTSSVAKGIAGALGQVASVFGDRAKPGLSPIKVDHIIKGYTGTMGMYVVDTLDMVMDQFGDSPRATKRFEQLPIIKRFALDPEARGNVTEYYKLKDSVDSVVRTMNFLEKQGESEEYVDYLKKNQGTFAFKDYIRDTEKTMKELRQMKSAVQISKMSGDEKRDAITGINRAENAINAEIQRIKTIISSAQ